MTKIIVATVLFLILVLNINFASAAIPITIFPDNDTYLVYDMTDPNNIRVQESESARTDNIFVVSSTLDETTSKKLITQAYLTFDLPKTNWQVTLNLKAKDIILPNGPQPLFLVFIDDINWDEKEIIVLQKQYETEPVIATVLVTEGIYDYTFDITDFFKNHEGKLSLMLKFGSVEAGNYVSFNSKEAEDYNLRPNIFTADTSVGPMDPVITLSSEELAEKGYQLFSQGKYDEALSVLEQALEINPNLSDAYQYKAMIFRDTCKYDEAISSYEKVLEIEPNYTIALGSIGILLDKQGKFDEAKSYYEKALEIDPEEPIAKFGLAGQWQLYDTPCVPSEPVSPADNEENGGCLIATATYGSELAPQVQLLREIRDNTVLSTVSETSFMTAFNSFYYSFSPTVADLERQSPVFKEMVKVAITPLISSLSLLQYVAIDSEAEMLGYGVGIILLNVGMYFVAPTLIIMRIRGTKKYRKN